jgi:hypothetical protein
LIDGDEVHRQLRAKYSSSRRRLAQTPSACLESDAPWRDVLLSSSGVDALLSVPLFLGFAFVSVVALVLLRKTWLFWLPGAALIGYGIALYFVWPWYSTHEDVALLEGVSNTLHVASTVGVVAAGVVCLLLGLRSHRRTRGTEIPTAIVMSRTDS